MEGVTGECEKGEKRGVDKVGAGQRQEEYNRRVEQRMEEMETMMEAQGERIIALEEEVAVLRTKKACKCGEANAVASSSGSREDPIELEEEELEYADEEGSNSNQSYHTPPRAEEALLVFGSPVSQTLPTDVSETCGCPIPSVIRIEDDVEMIAVPQENKEPLPIRVEEPPRYYVGSQRASRGHPQAHFRSSTHHRNRHAKQLGSCPYPGFFMGQDRRFPCVEELRSAVLRVERGERHSSSGRVEVEVGTEVDVPFDADRRSSSGPSSTSPHSEDYRPCPSACGGDCL